MSTTDPKVILTDMQRHEQAVLGVHRPLILVEAPAGVSAAWIGTSVVGRTLAVDGAYTFLIDTAGLASTLKVHFTATLTTATATAAGPDGLSIVLDPRTDTIASATVISSGTGDGSVTTATQLTSTLTLSGERWARYTITIASAGTAAVTLAEYVGL